jgi:acyl dehydratase
VIGIEVVGTELGEVRFPIERGKVAELARACGDDDPVWRDPDAARAAGFDAIPTPPTVTVLADHWRAGGLLGVAEALGADPSRVLHGEVEWEYLDAVRCGDELTARQRVADVAIRHGRRGGAMTLVVLETAFLAADGTLVARRRDTLIERAAP